MMPENALDHDARRLDSEDALRAFRERFYLPPGRVYLDGNSLGLMSCEAEQATLRVLAQWRGKRG